MASKHETGGAGKPKKHRPTAAELQAQTNAGRGVSGMDVAQHFADKKNAVPGNPTATGGTRPATDHVDASHAVSPLSQQELHDLIRKAGGTEQEATLLAAVGMAESGGLPTAYNAADPHGGSYGIWQINGANNTDHNYLRDPLNNAKEALRILHSQGIKAWGAYTNGSYKQYTGGKVAETTAVKPTVTTTPATAPAMSGGAPVAWDGSVKSILDYATQFQGTPYKWGGNDLSSGVDCSGLVQQVFGHFGISLPRVSAQQAKAGTQVSAQQAQPGDLVWFDTGPRNVGADHIGIYLGGGQMLVAPQTGDVVKIQAVDTAGAKFTRVIKPKAGSTTSPYAGLSGGTGGLYSYTPTVGAPAGAGGASGATAPPDPAAFQKALDASGWTKAVINSDPSLKQLFQDAATYGFDATEFQHRLENTDWWKKRNDYQRAYDKRNVDPAQHQQLHREVEQQTAFIQAQAVRLGIPMTPLRAHDLAVTSLRNGFSTEEIQNAVGHELHYDPKVAYGGTLGSSIDNIKQWSSQQYVSVSDDVMGQWAANLASGAATEQQYKDFIKQQAVSKFSWLKDQLDAGFTVSQIADQYKQEMGRILEIDPNSIKNDDPTVLKGLQYMDPQAKGAGQYTTMPLWAFQQQLRDDPRYEKTSGFRDNLMDIGTSLLKDWGLVT